MAREGSPRFLIARMSAIGDTVLTLPVLCALRRAYPDAFIAWVVERGAAPVLERHDCLDELIVLPRLWIKSPRLVWQLRQRLRSLQIHTTIDPQSITKTALACRLSGAPRRIGLGGSYGRELSPWLNNLLVPHQFSHVVDRSLELLQPIGILHPEAEFRLPRNAAAETSIASFLDDAPQRFAVVNPGASWDSKLWPTERFAEVCRYLGEQHDLPSIIVWAGEREREWAEQIVSGAREAARLAPRTSLQELIALVRQAHLFVGSDTGPMHIAAAAGTPCVALFGATRPEDCGPYGMHHMALQVRYQAGSRKQRRRATNEAMRLITVDHVCQACDHVLGLGTGYRTTSAA